MITPVIIIVVVVVLLVLAWLATTYNRLVRLRNKLQEAWAGIDVQLQRRLDLIPNLVQVVKGYATHEEDLFNSVTMARNAVRDADGPAATERASKQLDQAMFSVFAVAEAYPELKASTNFLDLQQQLAATEDELAFARRFYNATVEDSNTAIATVPTNLVAGPFGFTRAEYYQASADAGVVPRIDLE